VKRANQKQSLHDPPYLAHPAFGNDREKEKMTRLGQPFRRRAVLAQLGAFAVILLVWKIPVINPIKLLVVLFHEMWHVLAALATGGMALGIAIDPGGAGVTLGMGGERAVILAAGYVGSFLMGAILWTVTAIWESDEVWLVLFFFSLATLLFGWLSESSAFYAYATVAAILVCPFLMPAEMQKFLLRLVGTASCLYPVIDVAGELIQKQTQGFTVRGQPVGSDVMELAKITGLSPTLLTVLWVTVAVSMVVLMVTWCSKLEATQQVKRSLLRRRRPQPMYHPLYGPPTPDLVRLHRIE